MANITITKTITQPEEVINQFADDLGYQERVVNPDYVPSQGTEFIPDPDWVKPEGWDGDPASIPTVANPDHVPGVGETTIPNPVNRLDFVSNKFDEMAASWFAQFAERTARQAAEQQAMQTVKNTKAAVLQTISTKT